MKEVTLQHLYRVHACTRAISAFKQAFPKGRALVNKKNAIKFGKCCYNYNTEDALHYTCAVIRVFLLNRDYACTCIYNKKSTLGSFPKLTLQALSKARIRDLIS